MSTSPVTTANLTTAQMAEQVLDQVMRAGATALQRKRFRSVAAGAEWCRAVDKMSFKRTNF